MCRTMATHKPTLGVLDVLRNARGPARRSLFGPVDRDQLRLECQASLRSDLEEASRRWSFDFAADQPLDGGDFQWEGVSGAKVPLLYRPRTPGLPQAEGRRAPSASRAGPPHTRKENVPQTPERCPVDLQSLEKVPEKAESARGKRKQTNITDFYQAKRGAVVTPRKSGQ